MPNWQLPIGLVVNVRLVSYKAKYKVWVINSGGAIGRGGEGGGRPPDSRFVTYGAPVYQVVHNLQN